MDPLASIAMPTCGVLISLTPDNTWATSAPGTTIRTAFIATDSNQPLSFATYQSNTGSATILRLLARPSRFHDMPHGVVIELHLSHDLQPGDTIHIALAQSGATTYYPPQQIDDLA